MSVAAECAADKWPKGQSCGGRQQAQPAERRVKPDWAHWRTRNAGAKSNWQYREPPV